MFTSISMFFSTITRVLSTLNILAGVGEDYALHFKADAALKLEAKKAALEEQQSL